MLNSFINSPMVCGLWGSARTYALLTVFSLFFSYTVFLKIIVGPFWVILDQSLKFLPKLTPRILRRSLHHFPNINSSSFPNISACVATLCAILVSPIFAPSRYRIIDTTSLEKYIFPASKPLWVVVGSSLYLLAYFII